jgi:hypothetical protein
MTTKLFSAFVIAGLLALPAHASIMTYTQGSASVISARDPYPTSGDRFTSSVSGANGKGSFSAWASANYGVMKVSAAGAAVGSNHAAAFASANISDSFTLSNSALTGTKGLLTVSFYAASLLSGDNYSPYASNPSAADFYFAAGLSTAYAGVKNSQLQVTQSLRVDDTPYANSSSSRVWTDDQTGTHDTAVTGNYFTLTQEFVWGTQLNMQMTMYVNGSLAAYPYGDDAYGSFSADASHSGYWAGITSITSGGVAVSDYVLTSVSGTDYDQSFVQQGSSVPEPGTLALVGVALAALGVARRRSR